ncbi:MAG: PIN domain-containing protein [Candidatus Kapaibacterium sp.]|nr:MAG: PIN domain-containing protein [Candidatus Kapabacteria bacterium]
MKQKVYIETSIPSFYHENRTDVAALARRNWTRQWWEQKQHIYEIYSSEAVYQELVLTPEPKRQKCLNFIQPIEYLTITDEILEIAEIYVKHKLMPVNAAGDALHLAIASFYQCHFLVTWNCKHLANANKAGHIRRVNSTLGLYVPLLTTPLELLGVKEYE